MRHEESIPHPFWLVGIRLVAFVLAPAAYFALVLRTEWFSLIIVLLLGWLLFDISGRIRVRRSDHSLGYAWTPFRQRTRREHLLNGAVALITTPVIMLFPITLGFLFDPLRVFEDRETFLFFLMFYAAPWSLGAFLLYRYFIADRTTSRAGEQEPRTED